MKVKYFIRIFKPMEFTFQILYYTDYFPTGMMINIPLPINADGTAYLEGEELHSYIMAYAPYEELRRRERVARLDTTYIDDLVLEQTRELQ